MTPMTATLVIAAMIALGMLYVLAPVALEAYRTLRGTRLVRCPETGRPAAVEINAGRGAFEATIGVTHPKLRECSRWPERADCGQECLSQIESAPQGCRVRTLLDEWYEGRSCVLCAKPIGHIAVIGNQPALMTPNGETVTWAEVPAQDLPEVLASHYPVCWNCHVTETFRRRYPELVIDWPARQPPAASTAGHDVGEKGGA